MLLAKQCNMRTKKDTFNSMNSLQSGFIARMAAAKYNGPLLRLCLPDTLQTSHKLALLKL